MSHLKRTWLWLATIIALLTVIGSIYDRGAVGDAVVVAARYHMRNRTEEFFSRSTSNASAPAPGPKRPQPPKETKAPQSAPKTLPQTVVRG